MPRSPRPAVPARPINTRSTPLTGCCSASTSRAAFLPRRRRVRLRITALPIFFVTVKPSLAGPSSSRGSTCSTTPGIGALRPLAAARWNSARVVRRPGAAKPMPRVRPKAACGPSPGGSPAPYGLRPSPYGSGTRAAACGPASTVGRCASRPILRWGLTRADAGSRRQFHCPAQAAAYRGALKVRQS